jgi:hypothetical protein
MGAGVAASPHCPCAVDTRPGRRGCPRGAVSRTESSRGLGAGPPGSVMSREAQSGFPRAPRRGRSPGGSPLGSSEILANSGSCLRGPRAEARFRSGRIPQPKPRACPTVREPKSRCRRFAAPGPQSPVLPDGRWAEALLPPVAARRLSPRFPPDGVSGPKSFVPACCGPGEPEDPPGPERSTTPAAFASAQGQARSIRMAAASSAARPPLRGPRRLVGRKGPLRSGCGRKALHRFRSIVSATNRKLSRNVSRAKRIPPVDNEDCGHKVRGGARGRCGGR